MADTAKQHDALWGVVEAARLAFNFLDIDEDHPNRHYLRVIGRALDKLDGLRSPSPSPRDSEDFRDLAAAVYTAWLEADELLPIMKRIAHALLEAPPRPSRAEPCPYCSEGARQTWHEKPEHCFKFPERGTTKARCPSMHGQLMCVFVDGHDGYHMGGGETWESSPPRSEYACPDPSCRAPCDACWKRSAYPSPEKSSAWTEDERRELAAMKAADNADAYEGRVVGPIPEFKGVMVPVVAVDPATPSSSLTEACVDWYLDSHQVAPEERDRRADALRELVDAALAFADVVGDEALEKRTRQRAFAELRKSAEAWAKARKFRAPKPPTDSGPVAKEKP